MISEWFMQLATGFMSWVASLFPAWTPPAEFTQLSGMVSTVMGWFVGLGVWVPWSLIGACVGIQLAAWAIALGVKAIRAAASHVPFVGGHGA